MTDSVFALTDKVAIVTGAGSGIGKTIALELAKAGAHVVIASLPIPTLSDLEEAAAEIRKLGRQSLAVATDVSKPKDVENMAQKAVKEFGRIDILVNNATGQTAERAARGYVMDMDPEDWDAVFVVDMKGTFLCCKAVGKVMMAQNKGKIINITSRTAVDFVIPGHTGYASAKAGVIRFTKMLAAEWTRYNINVNCISVGFIPTKVAENALKKMGVRDKVSQAGQREGRAEDIAYGAVYLASEASDYVNGILLPIDGGPLSVW